VHRVVVHRAFGKTQDTTVLTAARTAGAVSVCKERFDISVVVVGWSL